MQHNKVVGTHFILILIGRVVTYLRRKEHGIHIGNIIGGVISIDPRILTVKRYLVLLLAGPLIASIEVVIDDHAWKVPSLVGKVDRQLILEAEVEEAYLPLVFVTHEVVDQVALTMQLQVQKPVV